MSLLKPGEIYHRIIMFDYDKVIVKNNPKAFKSMEVALKMLSKKNGFVFNHKLFLSSAESTSGTTEERFLEMYLKAISLPNYSIMAKRLIDDFARFRVVNLRKQSRTDGKIDRYLIYHDFNILINRLKLQDTNHRLNTLYAIVTGNPHTDDLVNDVMTARIPYELKKLFDIIQGGESGKTRKYIIEDLLNNINRQGHIAEKTRMFYIDDSPQAIIDVVRPYKEGPRFEQYSVQGIYINRGDPHPDLIVSALANTIIVNKLDDHRLIRFL